MMKRSFDSNAGSDHLAEFLQSKMGTKSRKQNSKAKYLNLLEEKENNIKRLQMSAVPHTNKKRRIIQQSPPKVDNKLDERRGSKTPILSRDDELKFDNDLHHFLETEEFTTENFNQFESHNQLKSGKISGSKVNHPKTSKKPKKSRNKPVKYSTYSRQASIAKWNKELVSNQKKISRNAGSNIFNSSSSILAEKQIDNRNFTTAYEGSFVTAHLSKKSVEVYPEVTIKFEKPSSSKGKYRRNAQFNSSVKSSTKEKSLKSSQPSNYSSGYNCLASKKLLKNCSQSKLISSDKLASVIMLNLVDGSTSEYPESGSLVATKSTTSHGHNSMGYAHKTQGSSKSYSTKTELTAKKKLSKKRKNYSKNTSPSMYSKYTTKTRFGKYKSRTSPHVRKNLAKSNKKPLSITGSKLKHSNFAQRNLTSSKPTLNAVRNVSLNLPTSNPDHLAFQAAKESMNTLIQKCTESSALPDSHSRTSQKQPKPYKFTKWEPRTGGKLSKGTKTMTNLY